MIRERVLLIVVGIFGMLGCSESLNPAQAPPGSAQPDASPIATTRYGRVRGTVNDDILVFKGVRYGGDTALTRFQAPRAPQP